jgi:anti-sigma regulatory factor (Ser/Thr protein kinase)
MQRRLLEADGSFVVRSRGYRAHHTHHTHHTHHNDHNDHNDQPSLETLCDTLTTTLLPAHHATTDDTALLIARTHTLTSDNIATWQLPENPIAARQARQHIRTQLATWNLDTLTPTTELLASELVGNVIRHAKGPIHLRLLRSRVLTCEVTDGTPTTPRVRRTTDTDEGGRGLQLVAALAHRWGVRYTANGKCLWTEQPLPPPDDRTTHAD